MKRYNSCIYCKKQTGSKEHLLPASIGGTIKYKDVICEVCNNHFSELDNKLAKQLNPINGLLGVKSEYNKSPLPAYITSNGQKEYAIDDKGNSKVLNSQVISEEKLEDGTLVMQLKAFNQKQIDDFIHEQRIQGNKVKVGQKQYLKTYPPEVKINMTIGGDDLLRESGRIVLNFLALRWPDIARREELSFFKEIVYDLNSLEPISRYVNWTQKKSFEIEYTNDAFSHIILIRLDKENSCIYGRLVFYGYIDFSIWLADCKLDKSENVMYVVDPLETMSKLPDSNELKNGVFPKTINQTDFITNDNNFYTAYQEKFTDLLHRIERLHFNRNYDPVIQEINTVFLGYSTDKEQEIIEEYFSIIKNNQELVYNILRHLKNDISNNRMGTDNSQLNELNVMVQLLDKLVSEDQNSVSGLSTQTQQLVDILCFKFSKELFNLLKIGPITLDTFFDLFKNYQGMSIVVDTIQDLLS